MKNLIALRKVDVNSEDFLLTFAVPFTFPHHMHYEIPEEHRVQHDTQFAQ